VIVHESFIHDVPRAGRVVFAVDPSLTCSGWAAARVGPNGVVVFAVGLMRAKRGADTAFTMAGGVASAYRAVEAFAKAKIEVVVIETPSTRVNAKRHRGRGAGLARYGMCVGEVIGILRPLAPRLIEFGAGEWGGHGKEKRALLAARHAAWCEIAGKDKGRDAADAVALIEMLKAKHAI